MFDDLTDEQLSDLERSLYDDEVLGGDTWQDRDAVLWEINRRASPITSTIRDTSDGIEGSQS